MIHAQTVQQIYEAFGKGDVPAILAKLASDVDWEYGDASTDVPWLQPRRGRDAVAGFFQALLAIDFHSFVPKTVLESGSIVVALVDLEATVRATGMRVVEQDEVHIWHFNDAGLVQRFRHRADTHLQWMAYHGK
jgi:ketosteroid isomerase-like protein